MSTVNEPDAVPAGIAGMPRRMLTSNRGAVFLVVMTLLLLPFFVKKFIVFQISMCLVYALAILALNILTGVSGQFSLGQSAFFALGAYVSAICIQSAGIHYAVTLPISALICFVCGCAVGLPALRLSGGYLALATFALAVATPPLLGLEAFAPWTGGVTGLVISEPSVPRFFSWIGWPVTLDVWLYYFVLASAAVIYAMAVNLVASRSGRAMMAIRDNETAATAMGVNAALYKTLAFGISAAITGVAGALGATVVKFVSPDTYSIQLAILLFIGMTIGGVGWLPGSLIGGLFVVIVPNIAEHVSKGLSGAIFGAMLLLMLFVFPDGGRTLRRLMRR